MFVANSNGPVLLHRNDTVDPGDWLRVDVRGSVSNRDGLGARVEVRTRPDGPVQIREIGVASHYLSQGERTAHFGLGAGVGTVDRVRVTWPASQAEVVLRDVARNQTLVVTEPAGE